MRVYGIYAIPAMWNYKSAKVIAIVICIMCAGRFDSTLCLDHFNKAIFDYLYSAEKCIIVVAYDFKVIFQFNHMVFCSQIIYSPEIFLKSKTKNLQNFIVENICLIGLKSRIMPIAVDNAPSKPAAKIELVYKTLFPLTGMKRKQKPLPKHPHKKAPKRFKSFITKRLVKPPSPKLWRKTIVLIKPKPKKVVPRLFRVDRSTGLPVDYERTVSRIMRQVNPQLVNAPSSDTKMSKMLARTIVEILGKPKNRCPSDIRQQVEMILKHHVTKPTKEKIQHDKELKHFHCACKRRSTINDEQIPTYNSRFNYNRLRIKSSP